MNTSLGYSKQTLTDSDVLLSGGGHKPVADFSQKTESIPYIKGPSTDTTAGTWTGSYSGITAYTEGLTILYVPAVAGASTTTLNLNNLGAKTCYISGSNTKLTTHYPVGTPIIFTYYNNGWRRAEFYSTTKYYLTLNGTVLGHSGKTNLGTFYAVATSDATAKDQVWMRNADNSAYAWRTLGSNAFNSTSYLPLTGGTMNLGKGLKFHSDNNYFGKDSDARIISLLDGNDTVCDGGLIIDERATLSGVEHVTELLRIRDNEFKWKGNAIWHAGNDGTNSGLDADLLDEIDGADYLSHHNVDNDYNTTPGQKIITVSTGSTIVSEAQWGSLIQWGNSNKTPGTADNTTWYNQLIGMANDRLYFRTRTNGGDWTTARKIAFITDNVASATYATNAGTALVGNKLNVLATISSYNTANYPWRLIARSAEITINYIDTEATIVLRQFFMGGRTGIIKIAFRTNEIATTASSVSAVWLNRYGFNVDDVKIAVYWVANKSYADVFLKATIWNRMEMHVIGNRSWSFVSSNEGTNGADPVNAYVSIEAAATALHGRAYTNIVTAIDGGIVRHANYATQASNDGDGNAINSTYLKRSGGTLSGEVKIHKSTAIDTYFEAKNNNGSIELLVGSSGNRGVYDGTGGTDGTWVIGTNGTNTWLLKGNVGIGTTSPAAKLHVAGSIRLNNGSGLGLINSSNTVVNGVYLDGTNLIYGMSHSGNTNIYAGNSINFRNTDGSVIKATIDSSGNVGIGTTSPEQKLDVNGYIKTSGIIKASSGSGYVLTGDGGHKALTNLQVTGTASALNALDVTKTFIYATVSSNQTLGVSAAMTVGQVLTVLVYNSGSSSITVTVPTSDSWKSLDGLNLTIGAQKFGEISILCYTATVYMVSAKLQ